MAAGPSSLLAFWLGGAGASSAVQAGPRSLLAPWIGGAAAPAATTAAGFTSFLALWLGGAASGAVTPPPPAEVRRKGHTWRTRVVRYRSRDRRWPRSTEY